MIEIVLTALGVYLAVGFLFAVAFHIAGIRRVDPGVEGGGWLFRLLITPGLVALWPLMLGRWRRASRGEDTAGASERPLSAGGLRAFHRRLAILVLLVVPALAVLAVVLRPAPRSETAPEVAAPALDAVLWQGECAGLPIALEVRARTSSDFGEQLVVDVARDLEIPSLGLFWLPEGSGPRPGGGVFLGSVWGPARRTFSIPAGSAGTLLFYSLAQGEEIGTCALGNG